MIRELKQHEDGVQPLRIRWSTFVGRMFVHVALANEDDEIVVEVFAHEKDEPWMKEGVPFMFSRS